MKDIYTYIDYRKYLRDFYLESKQSNPNFSYRYFSKKAEIKSPVFLKLVTENKRNLTVKMIEKFSNPLKLSTKEYRYFKHLVLFNQARTQNEKQEHYIQIRSLSNAVKETQLESDQLNYYSNWYNSVIRELVCLHDFQDDFNWLGNCLSPKISEEQVEKSVQLLLELELIKRQKNGIYKQTNKAITSGSKVVLPLIRSFNDYMLSLAKLAIKNVDVSKRHASGVTMGISRECYQVIEAEIEAFKERIVKIVHTDENPNDVYQLNLALFPLSDTSEKIHE